MVNRILDAIPAAERRSLDPHLMPVPLLPNTVLAETDRPLDGILFPQHGVVSLLTIVESGQTVEAALVGTEGALGAETLFGGAAPLPLRAVVQLPGDGVQADALALREGLERMPVLRSLLQAQLVALLRFATQTIACNRFHLLPQRCARWLLLLADRVPMRELPITQDLLGQMLGAHRPGVSVALRVLERGGAISQTRGAITILDRERLVAHACECYRLSPSPADP